MFTWTQKLLTVFIWLSWGFAMVLLVAMPGVLTESVNGALDGGPAPRLIFVVFLTAFLALLSVGVAQRWRWTFWLIVVAFLAGSVRVPVALLSLENAIGPRQPVWYILLQGGVGLIQFGIALALLKQWRASGAWGIAPVM